MQEPRFQVFLRKIVQSVRLVKAVIRLEEKAAKSPNHVAEDQMPAESQKCLRGAIAAFRAPDRLRRQAVNLRVNFRRIAAFVADDARQITLFQFRMRLQNLAEILILAQCA